MPRFIGGSQDGRWHFACGNRVRFPVSVDGAFAWQRDPPLVIDVEVEEYVLARWRHGPFAGARCDDWSCVEDVYVLVGWTDSLRCRQTCCVPPDEVYRDLHISTMRPVDLTFMGLPIWG